LLHMPMQIPVIVGLAGKLRCRQFKKCIIIRNESPSPIITKSLLIQSLNDASVLNDIFLCGALVEGDTFEIYGPCARSRRGRQSGSDL